MADEKEVLWGMYEQNMEHSRHYQDQRATTTNLVLVLAAALIGLMTYDQKLGDTDVYPASALIVLGCFGALWNAKHHERVAFYRERARGYRAKLDSLLPGASLVSIKESADAATEKKYGPLYWTRLWWLWLALDGMIVCLGIWLVIMCRR